MSSKNIKVVVKARPVLKKEKDLKLTSQWQTNGNSIRQTENQSGEPFYFDHVFNQDASNCVIFDNVAKPIIDYALKGFNGTIFAYGQTSSGKTYTMLGSDEDPGVIMLAAKEIFKQIELSVDKQFLLRVGYIEIYNEKVFDLLSKTNQELKIHENLNGDVTVNCEEFIITSEKEMMEYLQKGSNNRKIGETNVNERSSRSHAIFRIIIESKEVNQTAEDGSVQISILNLVDLAGSERADQTGATGTRLKEGAHINKSLLYLSCVINKLSENNESIKYINYRDSKLTRILQASLGGNALTAIICNINPTAIEETYSTLSFAMRAKVIKTKPQVNEVISDTALMKRLEKKIARLESELEIERTKNSKIKILQLEKQIHEEEIKIVHSHSSYKKHGNKLRRRTWAPCDNSSNIAEAIEVENVVKQNRESNPPSINISSRPKLMTPLITLRDEPLTPIKPFSSKVENMEYFDELEEQFVIPEEQQGKCNCICKNDDIVHERIKLIQKEYDELEMFTNLEKQCNVDHEYVSYVKSKLEELQKEVDEYKKQRMDELTNQLQISFADTTLNQSKNLNMESPLTDINKSKILKKDHAVLLQAAEEKIKSLEEQMNENNQKYTPLIQNANEKIKSLEMQLNESEQNFERLLKNSKDNLNQLEKQLKDLKEKFKNSELKCNEINSKNYELEQHHWRAKEREKELLELLAEKDKKFERLEVKLSFEEDLKRNQICKKEHVTPEMTATVQKLKEQLRAIQSENNELSMQLMESIQESESFKKLNSDLQQEVQQLQNELEKDYKNCKNMEIYSIIKERKSFVKEINDLRKNQVFTSTEIHKLNELLNEIDKRDEIIGRRIFDLVERKNEVYSEVEGSNGSISHENANKLFKKEDSLEEGAEMNIQPDSLEAEPKSEIFFQESDSLSYVEDNMTNNVANKSISEGNSQPDLIGKLQILNKKVTTLKNQSKRIKEKSQDELNILKETITDLNCRINDLCKNINVLTEKNMLLQSENHSLKSNITEQQQFKDLLEKIEILQASERLLQNKMKQIEENAEQISKEKISINDKLIEVTGQNDFLISKVETLEVLKNELEKNLNEFKTEKNKIQELEGRINEISKEKSELHQKLLEASKQNDIYYDELKELKSLKYELEKDLENSKMEISNHKEVIENSNFLTRQIEEECSGLKSSIAFLADSVMKLEKERNYLLSEKEELKKYSKSEIWMCMEAEMANLKYHNIDIMRKLENCKVQYHKIFKDHKEKIIFTRKLMINLKNLHLKYHKNLTKNEVLQQKNNELSIIINNLQQNQPKDAIFKRLEEDFGKVKEELEKSLTENKILHENNDKLNVIINSFKQNEVDMQEKLVSYETLEEDFKRIQEKFNNSLTENNTLHEENEKLTAAINDLKASEKIMQEKIVNFETLGEDFKKIQEKLQNSSIENKILVESNEKLNAVINGLKQNEKVLQEKIASFETLEEDLKKIQNLFDIRCNENKVLHENNEKLTAAVNDLKQNELISREKLASYENFQENFKKIQETLEKTLEENKILHVKNEDLKLVNKTLENNIESIQDRIILCKSLEEDLKNIKQEFEKSKFENLELQKKNAELKALQLNQSNIIKSFEENIKNLEEKLEKILEENTLLQEKNKELIIEGNATLRKSLDDDFKKLQLQLQHEQSAKENQVLCKNYEELMIKYKNIEEREQILQASISTFEENVKILQEQLEKNKTENKILQGKNEELNTTINSLRQNLQSLERKEASFKDSIKNVQQKLEKNAAENKTLHQKNGELASIINNFKQNEQMLQEKLILCESLENKFKAAQETLEKNLKENRILLEKNEELVAVNKNLQQSLELIQKRVAFCNSLEENLKKIQQQLEQSTIEKNTLQKKNDELMMRSKNLEQNEQKLQQKEALRVFLEDKIKSLQQQLEKNIKENKDLQEKTKEFSAVKKTLQEDIQKLHQKLIKTETENKILQETNKELNTVKNNFEQQNQQKIQRGDVFCKFFGESSRTMPLRREKSPIESKNEELLAANKNLQQSQKHIFSEVKVEKCEENKRRSGNQDRKYKRQSTHDEKRESLWQFGCDKGTMTESMDKLCNCTEMDIKINEFKSEILIKNCQINNLLEELKNHPLTIENEKLKKLLIDEEQEAKKQRIEISKLKQKLILTEKKECQKCSVASKRIYLDKFAQTDEFVNNSAECDEVEKCKKKMEDLRKLCRIRKERIEELENTIKSNGKENEMDNKQINSLNNYEERLKLLQKENEVLQEKYNYAKYICISRRDEIKDLMSKLNIKENNNS